MWTARLILQAALSVLLISFDPFMRCLAGDVKSIGKFCFRVEVQNLIFEESLSLFTHGNTFPGHGMHLLHEEVLPMSLEFVLPMSLEFSVTYVPERFRWYSI